MGSTVFASDWYKQFISLQRNPKAFADRRKLSREDLCMYMLKDLYSDSVNSQSKCHIMLLFQEHESYIIGNETVLEQVIGSLESLYNLFVSNKENRLLKIHVIITMTTLLLSWDTPSGLVNIMCRRLREMLFTIIFSENKDHLLRSSACQCLTEMENCFPGYLKEEQQKLFSAVQNRQLFPVQNYVLLFSTCLKYKVKPVAKGYNGHSGVESKPLSPATHGTFRRQPSDVQLHHAIASMMDILPSMSTTSVYHILYSLKHIVEGTPELLPSVFKLFLPKLMMSSDVLQFHLGFDLLKTFETELFSSQEEILLLRQLLVNIKHPLLSHPHRMLYLDWLQTFLRKKDVFSIRISPSCLEVLVPGVFDNALVQAKKISAICLYLQSFEDKAQCGQFTFGCLMGLKRQIFMKPLITTVSAFFHLLYCMFLSIDSSQSDMQKLLVEVVSSSPHLSPFILDFLKCVKKECCKKDFCDGVLSLLVNHVVNLTPKQCAQDIDCFLPIFEAVVLEAPHVSKPQVILGQLKKVLSESGIQSNTWEIGHHTLTLCCIFLKHHDIESIYHDLGEVLNLIMNNIKNCDCQDRAKQYYAALTSLPQSRVKELFAHQKLENKGNISLTTIVSGTETGIFSRNIILEDPILELVRMDITNRKIPTMFEADEGDDSPTLKEKYLDFLCSENFRPVVRLPFVIKHVKGAPTEFSTLYSVVITSTSISEELDIADIEVPVLRNSGNNEGANVTVEFTPRFIGLFELHLQVFFTASSGSSFRFNLPPINLKLEDFFSLLPVEGSTNNLRKRLFDELWAEETRYVSKFHINRGNLTALVEEHWKPFVVNEQRNMIYDIAVFLPPTSHFLMTVENLNNAGLAVIKTNKESLPFVSMYMIGISEPKLQCLA